MSSQGSGNRHTTECANANAEVGRAVVLRSETVPSQDREADKDEVTTMCVVMHQRPCQPSGTLCEVDFGPKPYFTNSV